MSDYVNREALREISDTELARALREDSMPADLYRAMLDEQARRDEDAQAAPR